MEGLVNYSSEDDQDEPVYNKRADGQLNRERERERERAADGRGRSYSERGSGGGGRYKDEIYERPANSSYDGSRREGKRRDDRFSSGSASRDLRGLDTREPRERKARDPRDRNSRDLRERDTRETGVRDSRDTREREGRDLRERERNSREFRDRSSRDIRERDTRDFREARDTRDFKNGHKKTHESSGEARTAHDRNYQRYGKDDTSRQERSRNDERHNNHSNTRNRSSGGNNNGSYDNSRSRHGNNQQTTSARRDDDRTERYSSSRHDQHHRQHQSNKHSSNSRRSQTRSRSRSRSKERKSPAPKKSTIPPTLISPRTEFRAEKLVQKEEPIREIAPLMALPLSETAPKLPNIIAVTNSAALAEAATTVIQLPSYYNPSAINPTKYAEQVQKRKLLWGAKKAEDTAAKWGNAHFSQDTDGKVASKFMRLMGIKNAALETTSTVTTSPNASEGVEKAAPDVKSREAMFSTMEQQYEVARQVTHTMRGVGLGFSSSRPF